MRLTSVQTSISDLVALRKIDQGSIASLQENLSKAKDAVGFQTAVAALDRQKNESHIRALAAHVRKQEQRIKSLGGVVHNSLDPARRDQMVNMCPPAPRREMWMRWLHFPYV